MDKNLNFELVDTFYRHESIVERPTIYRVNTGAGRLYYKFESGVPVFYLSLTTLIKAVLPTEEHLIKWIADMGFEESKQYAKERADYGTAMHILCAELLRNGVVNLDQVEQTYPEWAGDLKHDLIAFARFVKEKNVKPLALEIVLVSRRGYGTAIDIVCEMDDLVKASVGVYKTGPRKGQPKEGKVTQRITGIVNLKSGRKGFHADNELQLEFERFLWNENYPEHAVHKIFNWAPKQPAGYPNYSLVDQTGKVDPHDFKAYLMLIETKLKRKKPVMKLYPTTLSLGELPEVKTVSLDEYVIRRHSAQSEEENAVLEAASRDKYDGQVQ
jgi:hypothetical protein